MYQSKVSETSVLRHEHDEKAVIEEVSYSRIALNSFADVVVNVSEFSRGKRKDHFRR